MFTTLAFTTLFASISAVAAADAGLTAVTPTNLVQCTNTTLSWTGGKAPYNVYVFTDCNDAREDPIATFPNVAGNSVVWYVNEVSGEGMMLAVEDATGNDATSDAAYVGGNAGADADKCAASLAPVSSTSTASPTSTNSVPTTMSNSKANVNGVANAAAAPTSSAPVSTSPALSGTPNGAASLSARPVQIATGFLVAAFAAKLL